MEKAKPIPQERVDNILSDTNLPANEAKGVKLVAKVGIAISEKVINRLYERAYKRMQLNSVYTGFYNDNIRSFLTDQEIETIHLIGLGLDYLDEPKHMGAARKLCIRINERRLKSGKTLLTFQQFIDNELVNITGKYN